eukprot:c20783_g1_i1 orf=122-646(+)
MACQIDFRCLDEGFGGEKGKRKRSEEGRGPDEDAMETDHQPLAKRVAFAGEQGDRPSWGRPTYDGVIAGKISGRKWKEPKTARASSIKVSHKRSTHSERSMLKEIKKAYTERMTELKEQIRQNKVAKRKQREEREKRKEENVLKSGTMYQKITNPKTLKKMSKKQRKLLKIVPE